MASAGLNKWIVSGNLGADVQVKTIDLRSGEQAQLATATLYVQGVRDRQTSFTVSLAIWERSAAWRKLPYLKKGSLVICTGKVEPRPYLSAVDNRPRAGLSMSVLDIDLDIVKDSEDEEDIVALGIEVASEDASEDAPEPAAVGS